MDKTQTLKTQITLQLVCGRGEKCGSSFLEKMKTMSLHGKNK
jgi:hypothetical protein